MPKEGIGKPNTVAASNRRQNLDPLGEMKRSVRLGGISFEVQGQTSNLDPTFNSHLVVGA